MKKVKPLATTTEDELAAMAAETGAQLEALLKRPDAKKPVVAKTRSEIREMIAANAKEVGENIYALMDRTLEDFVAGGIDHTRVANATLYVGLCHQQRIFGTVALIAVLRSLADFYERKLASCAQSDRAGGLH